MSDEVAAVHHLGTVEDFDELPVDVAIALMRGLRVCPDCGASLRVPFQRRSGRWYVLLAHELGCPRFLAETHASVAEWTSAIERYQREDGF